MSEGGVSSSHSRLIIHSVSTCYGPDRGSRGWRAEVRPGEQRAGADGYNPCLSAGEGPAFQPERARLTQPTQACENEAPGVDSWCQSHLDLERTFWDRRGRDRGGGLGVSSSTLLAALYLHPG